MEKDMREEAHEWKIEEIEEILELMKDTNIWEFKWEKDGKGILLRKEFRRHLAQPIQGTHIETGDEVYMKDESRHVSSVSKYELQSNFVGIIEKMNAQVGDSLRDGDVICVVRSMNIENELEVVGNCRVIKKLLNEGDAVEYGQAIYLLEPIED